MRLFFSTIVCTRPRWIALVLSLFVTSNAPAQNASFEADVRKLAAGVEQKLITWRRDIHQHPELGDQEKRTAKIVTEHLQRLGLKVRTGVARNGVVGVLKGAKAGRTIALRADMDGLAVKETTGTTFAAACRSLRTSGTDESGRRTWPRDSSAPW